MAKRPKVMQLAAKFTVLRRATPCENSAKIYSETNYEYVNLFYYMLLHFIYCIVNLFYYILVYCIFNLFYFIIFYCILLYCTFNLFYYILLYFIVL